MSILCKNIHFYASFILDLMLHNADSRPWWNEINSKIILGAMPHRDCQHIEKLKKENITAVITLNEHYELEPSFLATPIKSKEWLDNGIYHLHINIPDMTPPSIEQINECINFINKHYKTYVHCKAGKGRSALIVICYLIKHENMTMKEAIKYTKERRNIINLNLVQMKRVSEYVSSLKNNICK